jgi:hypothetical protein
VRLRLILKVGGGKIREVQPDWLNPPVGRPRLGGAGAPVWLPSWPHFAWLLPRVFWIVLELMFGSSLNVNLTCGPPFLIILITPYKNKQSPKLVEFYY